MDEKDTEMYKDSVNSLYVATENQMEKNNATSTDGKYNTTTEPDARGRVKNTPERMEVSNTETERARLKKPEKKRPVNYTDAKIGEEIVEGGGTGKIEVQKRRRT